MAHGASDPEPEIRLVVLARLGLGCLPDIRIETENGVFFFL